MFSVKDNLCIIAIRQVMGCAGSDLRAGHDYC
jgi:hypothetical protein